MQVAMSLAVMLLLAACGSAERAPRSTSVCDLAQQPQRLVGVDAVIGDGSA